MNQSTIMLPSEIHRSDDEIDLFELAEALWRHKAIIVTISLLVTVMAALFAFFSPATWESEITIYQVDIADLAGLNASWGLINSDETDDPISPTTTYESFYRFLISPAVQWQAFEKSSIATTAKEGVHPEQQNTALRSAWDQLQSNLNITRSDAKANQTGNPVPFINVSFRTRSSQLSTDFLNNYLVPEARKATLASFTRNIESNKNRKLEKIDREVAQIETAFIENNQVKEIALQDALKIASAGNIKQSNDLNLSRTLGDKSFMLGTNILQEQLDIQQNEIKKYRLVSRPEFNFPDKPLLPTVASIMVQQRQKVANLNLKNVSWEPVSVDLPALIPTDPIKPKKAVIIALGLILGGMLGVFVALIQIAIKNRRPI